MKKKNILALILGLIVLYIVYDVSAKNSIGLGDTVAHFLQSLGIEKVPGCRCENRHQWLNKWFPYHTRIQYFKPQ